jgi:hypothetical protein
VTTGERDNVVVIRKGAETEIQSAIDRASGECAGDASGRRA